MRNLRAAPDLRSPLSKAQELRRQAVFIEAAVAAALFLSIFTLLLAIAETPVATAWKLGALA
jgi:hypothetical protein